MTTPDKPEGYLEYVGPLEIGMDDFKSKVAVALQTNTPLLIGVDWTTEDSKEAAEFDNLPGGTLSGRESSKSRCLYDDSRPVLIFEGDNVREGVLKGFRILESVEEPYLLGRRMGKTDMAQDVFRKKFEMLLAKEAEAKLPQAERKGNQPWYRQALSRKSRY